MRAVGLLPVGSLGGSLICALFLFFCPDFVSAQPDCKLRKNESGIKVYICHVDTSRFKSIKAEFDIACSMNELIQTIADVPGYTKWQFNTVSGKILHDVSVTEKIYRTEIAAPWPVSDRDMIVRMVMEREPNRLLVTAASQAGIVPVDANFVRVPFSLARWEVVQKDRSKLYVRYEMLIDPGGDVPVWLVNWTCAHAPLQSFQKLKTLLEKK